MRAVYRSANQVKKSYDVCRRLAWSMPRRQGSTEFETKLSQLRLTNETCASSAKLREWCFQNKNRCYIPEWLLKKGGNIGKCGYGRCPLSPASRTVGLLEARLKACLPTI